MPTADSTTYPPIEKPAEHSTSSKTEKKFVRLSVNLAPDVARPLRDRAQKKSILITEAIRRAIVVWNFVETERDKGNRLAVIERVNDEDGVREMVLVD
jgi:hypothetical protein